MKYDTAEVASEGTSHSEVLALVGSGRRVLDIGCSTGYLAEALAAKGNEVAGLELDPEAAAQARARIADVTVGDITTMDLEAAFDSAGFDALVFADVLEHVVDPGAVLRRCRSLLAPNGFVVASIPNVAHGAVRLSLLGGRFSYRPLGLLDDTHLRFFTAATIRQLFELNGFTVTEVRRARLGFFDTEIRLDRSAFPEEVIDLLMQDPESLTYQYVVKAVPGQPADEASEVANLLAERDEEVARLRSALAAIARAASPSGLAETVGVLQVGGDARLGALSAAAVGSELAGRLMGFRLPLYTCDGEVEQVLADGTVRYPFGPANEGRAAAIASRLDSLVLVGQPSSLPGGVHDMLRVLRERGCHAYAGDPRASWVNTAPGLVTSDPNATGGAGATLLDPLLLIGRSVRTDDVASRCAFLRRIGHLPEGPYIAVRTGAQRWDSDAASRAFEDAARILGAGLVNLDRLEDPHDLLSVMASAVVVISDDVPTLVAATGVGANLLALVDGSARLDWCTTAGSVQDVPSLCQAATKADAEAVRAAVGTLEQFLDGLADQLLSDVPRRLDATVAQRLAELQEQVGLLQAANDTLRRQLTRQREELASSPTRTGASQVEHWEQRNQLQGEIDTLRDELHRVYQTKTMRALQPARQIYGRIRRR